MKDAKNNKISNLRNISPRNLPVQQRAQQRREEILSVTANLLESVGLDDLTTILVAKTLGISVGTLYHYFPNKHAILYALAEQWLGEMDAALQQLNAAQSGQSLRHFVDHSVNTLLEVYTHQRGLLPLVQAMFGIPELKALDDRHDQLVIDCLSEQFRLLDLGGDDHNLRRLARTWLELTHALLLVVVNQQPVDSAATLAELKQLCLALLERSRGQF